MSRLEANQTKIQFHPSGISFFPSRILLRVFHALKRGYSKCYEGDFDLKEGTSSGYQTARTMRKTQQRGWLVGTSIPVMGLVAKSKTGRQRRTLGNTHSVRTQITQLLDCCGIDIVEMTRNVKRSCKRRKMEHNKKCNILTMLNTVLYGVVILHCQLW